MKPLSFGLVVLVLTGVLACGDDGPEQAVTLPTAVRIQPHDIPVLDKGQSVTFTLQFTGPNADVVWQSSNQSIVTVDEHGIAKAAGAGTAWVYVQVKAATTVRDSVQFTVRDNPTLLTLQ